MKKLFLTIAVALGVFTAVSAQSNMWVGGTAGIWSSKEKGGDSQLSFKVMPEFGYILNSNVGIGIALGGAHDHGSTNFDGNMFAAQESSTNTYIVNPFLRYTFLKGDLGGLFFDGGVSYGWSKGTTGGLKGSQLEVGLRPGVALSVSNKITLLGKFGFLGYQNLKYDYLTIAPSTGIYDKTTRETNSFGFDFDMRNIEFGVNYKF
ncbi:outer membrane protein with beta-barrel domain [Dysgonomonas alginatilytica]|uniref:Outer membrane protein with beta-barrel domain n=1 Tax=Dysgonomonas alginatilytica TaxID=1605892 RepID=A0A2V3PMQ7_9BACT|nr:outer membrane beta-barrel protein [Dysgonomonas alginatilytica]PXV62208.1 outer membrane protein with beta-barrel domain [Dysgonomonas alginatilytica]